MRLKGLLRFYSKYGSAHRGDGGKKLACLLGNSDLGGIGLKAM